MELKDLLPEKPEFKLSKNGKTYALRIPNLEDRVAIISLAGGMENVQKIFTEMRWDVITKIVYRLMEDRSDFKAVKETVINEEGLEETRMVYGPTMLMRMASSQEDSVALLGALTTAITSGEPVIKEYVDSEIKKKQNQLTQTGEKSLTLSPASTDTPQKSLAS